MEATTAHDQELVTATRQYHLCRPVPVDELVEHVATLRADADVLELDLYRRKSGNGSVCSMVRRFVERVTAT